AGPGSHLREPRGVCYARNRWRRARLARHRIATAPASRHSRRGRLTFHRHRSATRGPAHLTMLYPAAGSGPAIDVRKLVLSTEEVWHDRGPRAAPPLRRGSIAAVLRNPYAGRYV